MVAVGSAGAVVAVGSYEDISSADVEGFTESLVATMPGLIEHRCSLGTRGGFVTRLRRGTYAPHIAEVFRMKAAGGSWRDLAMYLREHSVTP